MNYCARVAGHCGRCEGELPFAFTMAFQPIVELAEARVVSFEALVRGVKGLADELDIALIAEGVETRAEALWLGRLGITRQQGFYFARP
ncbi:EAL domain-containing protein [Halomonas korlensis]|uniref:EAL domain-containing protein n=1 Tax=Halomonas korlensis TaxID=463301 RepID=A0A1I7GSG2_9GAMM|nr:EAL domain-containing protein [Halomonas korlensis]SFU51331.1 EAL domain-containing protein [Halomonas korlensis]